MNLNLGKYVNGTSGREHTLLTSVKVCLLICTTLLAGKTVYANEDWASVEYAGTVELNLLENDGDVNPESFYILEPAQEGWFQLGYGGNLTYNHHFGGASSDRFTYMVADWDGNYYGPTEVNIDVDNHVFYDHEMYQHDLVTVTDGGSVDINLVSYGANQDASTTFIYHEPANGDLDFIYDGTVRYTNYESSGDTDNFSYIYADYDGNFTDPIYVNINVDSAIIDSSDEPNNGRRYRHWRERGGNQEDGGVTEAASEQSNETVAPESTPVEPTSVESEPVELVIAESAPTPTPTPTQPAPTAPTPEPVAEAEWWQPKASENLKWQIQLQGDLELVEGVDVYAVDYTASQASIDAAKATGAKVMCYISAGSAEDWRPDYSEFPDGVIGNAYENWPGEWWLDTRNIGALAPIMRARMIACRDKGFDAIDADNVNGFENNTGFYITREDSIEYIIWLAEEAHSLGMAFSLKNSESLVEEVRYSVDMMQSESCFVYSNCANASKMSDIDKPVFAVEYEEAIDQSRFWEACGVAEQYSFSMVYRDIRLFADGIYLSCN